MRSEVADITGIVNSPVKVFFSTKMLEGSAPPPSLLNFCWEVWSVWGISLLMLRLKDAISTLYECQSQVHVFIGKSLIKWMWSSSYRRLQTWI